MKKFSASSLLSEYIKEFSKEKTPQETEVGNIVKELIENSHLIEKHFQDLSDKSKKKLLKASFVKIENETWVRSVSFNYSKQPLSFQGSMLSNSRFNEKGNPTIYLAQNADVAISEVQFPVYFNATTTFGVEVNLQFILDLSDTSKLNKDFGINKQLFRSPWKQFNNIKIKFYTQYLADHLRALPIEGFIYESVQKPGFKCLCLFPDKMIKGSYLRVVGNYKEIGAEELFYNGSI